MSEKKQLSILLADDEEIIHLTIGDYLCDLGHSVTDVYNSGEALDVIEKKNFDLVIIDLQMPGNEEFMLLEKIRKLAPEAAVLIITGSADSRIGSEAIQKGACEFLPKPVPLESLDAIVNNLAERT